VKYLTLSNLRHVSQILVLSIFLLLLPRTEFRGSLQARGDESACLTLSSCSGCHLCLNCIDQRPQDGLAFKFFPNSAVVEGPDLKRRKALTSMVAGAALIPLLRSTTGASPVTKTIAFCVLRTHLKNPTSSRDASVAENV
jgi:hypothetical protein